MVAALPWASLTDAVTSQSPTINFSTPFRKPEDMWPTQEELAMRRVDVGADSPYQAESRKSSAHSARSLKNVARKVFRR